MGLPPIDPHHLAADCAFAGVSARRRSRVVPIEGTSTTAVTVAACRVLHVTAYRPASGRTAVYSTRYNCCIYTSTSYTSPSRR